MTLTNIWALFMDTGDPLWYLVCRQAARKNDDDAQVPADAATNETAEEISSAF